MMVIAHRGASAELPENTLAAFERAAEVGADMIEMDVRASRDGVLYVAHDRLLDPGDRLHRPPRWAGRGGRPVGEAEPPDLDTVLDRFAGRLPLNLELKERRAALLLADLLQRRRLADGILVSSFDLGAMRIFRARAAHVATGYLARRPPVRLRFALAAVGATSLHLPRRSVTAKAIRRTHRAGARLFAWTVDDPADMRRLGALGVDGIFTNRPAVALAVRPG
jgi:glycerophosphoryl diester phosphodiesterase